MLRGGGADNPELEHVFKFLPRDGLTRDIGDGQRLVVKWFRCGA